MRIENGMVPDNVTLTFGTTTFFFSKERTVALLLEATASTMEGTMDGLPRATLIGGVDALVAAFVVELLTTSAVD